MQLLPIVKKVLKDHNFAFYMSGLGKVFNERATRENSKLPESRKFCLSVNANTKNKASFNRRIKTNTTLYFFEILPGLDLL